MIELLVVLAISALLVGLAPVALQSMREAVNYRDTVRSVLTTLRLARQEALVSRREVRFVVNTAGRSYRIDAGKARTIPEPLQVNVTTAAVESGQQESGIRFFPSGGATGGSVDVVRPSGDGTRLRVDWLSGRVSQEAMQP
ncbi:GspH/FimT family protein [Comamonas sp. NLF-1-9]|uniref:GspH/FimT family pseudopilin n=1 Tax=Comamonas sp. NLF-1-9 TaxID=2853163 RepID=UPI002102D1BE|nr:GspH/FimT family protein [Comamonas sp. NLF-1-9]